ncbi:MAG: GIY-YIG nuclease family protein [Caulobacteraceae bacterium]|nr:GIY-YIG nuclease family protein [Caulobacteraceae bacterium]
MLNERMPAWDKIILTCAKIKMCPASWIGALSGYKGIYFIFDRNLQKGYVGAAYGLENIWQRWSRHAAVGGDARELKRCNPDDFVFSILQLVGKSALNEEVQALEASWKRRLPTREFGLNAN